MDGPKCLPLLAIVIVAGIDRLPETCSLQLNMHRYHPLGLVCPSEYREVHRSSSSTAGLPHHLPHHDLTRLAALAMP